MNHKIHLSYFLFLDLKIFFFFFNDTATTEIYTLSLHDALPTSSCRRSNSNPFPTGARCGSRTSLRPPTRSEEHTSELQSHHDLVCRLLLEKKKLIHVGTAVVITTLALSAP